MSERLARDALPRFPASQVCRGRGHRHELLEQPAGQAPGDAALDIDLGQPIELRHGTLAQLLVFASEIRLFSVGLRALTLRLPGLLSDSGCGSFGGAGTTAGKCHVRLSACELELVPAEFMRRSHSDGYLTNRASFKATLICRPEGGSEDQPYDKSYYTNDGIFYFAGALDFFMLGRQ